MKNIVLVGAGGTGMSGVVGILHDLGFKNLLCIDAVQGQLTDKLVEKGIFVIIGHGKYEVSEDDAVIYSEATVNSPEVQKAKSFQHNGKKPVFVMNYFEFLGEVSKYFKTVGIAGTNGKSSTSSLAIYTASKVLPDFALGILGALVPDFGNNSYLINQNVKGDLQNIFESIFSNKEILDYDLVKKYYFFLEACEYKRHFLNLDLEYAVITNMNLDHTDYFKSKEDYISAFESLVLKTRRGVLMFEVESRKFNDENEGIFDKLIFVDGEEFEFDNVFGEHWNWNASFVESLVKMLKWSNGEMERNIMQKFKGLWRRMELLGNNGNGAKIFSDYGHIAESIGLGYDALKKKFSDKKLLVIFQPHQMKRVVVGWKDFVEELKKYDEVWIYDIYAARENLMDFGRFEKFQQIEGEITKEKIGNLFAEECAGKYISDKSVILQKIREFNEDCVVVIFTAGDLDYLVRSDLGL